MRIEFSTAMKAPQDQVFDVLSDPRKRPDWQRSLRSVHMEVDEPPALGNRWRERTKLGPAFTMETVIFDRPNAWSERGRGPMAGAELHVKLAPRADGPGTDLSLTLELTTRGPLRLLSPLLPFVIEKELRADLERLDQLALAAS